MKIIRCIGLALLLLTVAMQEPKSSAIFDDDGLDSIYLFYSVLTRAKYTGNQHILPDFAIIPLDSPAILSFSERATQSNPNPTWRANTVTYMIILSGYFTRMEITIPLEGYDRGQHRWNGSALANISLIENIFSKKEISHRLTYLINSSQASFTSLQAPNTTLSSLIKYKSSIYHFSGIRLLIIVFGSLLLYACAWTSPSKPPLYLSFSLLLSKLLFDFVLLCVDNVVVRKPLQAAYIDVFAALLYGVEIAGVTVLVWRGGRKWVGLAVMVGLIEAVVAGIPSCQLMGAMIMLPQLWNMWRRGGKIGGTEKGILVLYVQYYANILGFQMFDDNYLYCRASGTVMISILLLTLLQNILFVLRASIFRNGLPFFARAQLSQQSQFDSSNLTVEIRKCQLCNCKVTAAQRHVTECRHVFHTNCLQAWMLNNQVCPIDKKSLATENLLV